MAKVSVVIVNYNGAGYQNACIRSLYEMDYKDIEIIVVDSASSDNSLELLYNEFPDVKIIRCNENVGVAAGNNIGIKYSRENGAEYTLLLNNDVEVSKHLLSELLKQAEPDTVIVPKIYYYEPKELIWYAGGELNWKYVTGLHFGLQKKDQDVDNLERIVSYSPTCCMLIHNSVFDRVGYMDEKYFMYFDDTDFCVRLGEHGIGIKYIPSAFLWHKVSSASGGSDSALSVYYCNRNQLYYMKKNKFKIKFYDAFYICIKAMAKGVIFPIRKGHKNDRYIISAYLDYVRGRMGRKDFTACRK